MNNLKIGESKVLTHCLPIYILLLILSLTPMPLFAQTSKIERYDIGILALRGHQATFETWQPTLLWLEEQIPNAHFTMHPYNFNQLEAAFLNDELDFIITSPGQATTLSRQFQISSLATIKTAYSGFDNRSIASVVIVREDSPYFEFSDLSGKKMAAVDAKAFGGFLAFRYEIYSNNFNEKDFFKNLTFTGIPTDDILFSLVNNDIEVAIVPACTLENMVKEGLLDDTNLRILEEQRPGNSVCGISTPLYPNWSWSKTERAHNTIGTQITQALLRMPHNHPAASINNSIGWTLPASNTTVDRVYKELNLHPLQKPWGQIVMEWVERQKILAFGILISIITIVIYHFILEYRFNRNRKALELSIFELKEKNTIIEQVQRNLIVNELGSSIAHEINQPLASIKNYAKGLQLRVGNSIDEEELSSILIRIEKQATVASDIVKRLRALIKKHNQEMSLCNPVDFIEESIELVDYEFSKACIEIDYQVFGAPQKVNFDVVGMQQVILNLLNNAKDACIAAGESRTNLKVDVQTYFEKEYIRIVVIDNGIGLGNVDLNAKPAFYSTKSTGLGLGLPICREIIEYHKGTLTINQNQPFGCIATVAIPNDGEIQ